MSPNQHIKDYLSYYLSFSTPPKFAILLDGPWGIGKTFLVKSFIESLADKDLRYVYVSLYGLASPDEIDDAIFRSTHPILMSRGVNIGVRVLKSLGKYHDIDIDLTAKDFLSKARSNIYIFDDLERCKMPINDVMGYINGFVEHDERKVIIIANEEEIANKDEYQRVREKLIGKTFKVQSVFEEAISIFTASIKNEKTRLAIQACSSVISEIYYQSELHNLRVLQQTIWDFERIYECLEEKHQDNNQAMTSLLGILFALSFEIKAGRLSAENLQNRQADLISSYIGEVSEGNEPLPINIASKRYPQLRLDSTLLSDETLVNLISKGIVDQSQIRKELDQSSFFVTITQEPSWRTVWNSYERTEKEVDNALTEMERAFIKKEFIVTGEILHVFGLRLWLAEIGAISQTKDEVIAECKSYVDHLYQNGKLELPPINGSFTGLVLNVYDRLGIRKADTPEYQELYSYLDEKRQAAVVEMRPKIAEELLVNMEKDPALFFRQVCPTNHSANEFADVPVLASLDPEKFVNTLLSLHPEQQLFALGAINSRYENHRIDRKLKEERDWATSVRKLLLKESEKMSPISKDRLRGLVTHGLDKVLAIQVES